MQVWMFAATRYWQEPTVLQTTFDGMAARLAEMGESRLIVDGDMAGLPECAECAVIVPMSGGVQPHILAAAKRCSRVILYAGYCGGNFRADAIEKMLRNNAAPTLMDTWGVLKRTHSQVHLAVTEGELCDLLCALRACEDIRSRKLILIGDTEPWVISNARDKQAYARKLGVEIEQVTPAEVMERYARITAEESRWLRNYYEDNATAMCGPSGSDLSDACRFGVALIKTLEAHEAAGGAIACFHLIAQTGTNACLGVGYINDCTDRFLACEGDLDSAVTMLLMKRLTQKGIWMANPCLDASGKVNFSHCTSPCHAGGETCAYTLKKHHETGVGVSLDVELPGEGDVTLCRVGNECESMTIHTGCPAAGAKMPVCHTQMWVKLDDYGHYLDTALGCHQVIAFENMERKLRMAAQILGLNVL